MYVNSTENQKRYEAIKAQYHAAAISRRTKIALCRANVEAAEATIKLIEQERTDLFNNPPQRWSREMIEYREGIFSRLEAARRRLERKRNELSAAQTQEFNPTNEQ